MSGEPISHVNVWADDDDLVVTWRGGSDALSVFVSDDPDDAGTVVSAPDAPGRTVVARTHGRQYVHLFEPEQGFVVAAERRLSMDGPKNFRDIGGYPTADGVYSRWGRVFRSDGLDTLSDADQTMLELLGVSKVFDLRSDAEVELAPDRLPGGIEHVHLPMSSDVAHQRGMIERIVDGDLLRFGPDDMVAGYLRMLEGFGGFFAEVIGSVAAGERILFHCTAGKDRTGIMAMALLGFAEVADPYLLDDYEISQQYRDTSGSTSFADRIRDAGHDPANFETMWQTPRPVMRQTIDGLRERWGNHENYVRFAGVDDDVAAVARAELRTNHV